MTGLRSFNDSTSNCSGCAGDGIINIVCFSNPISPRRVHHVSNFKVDLILWNTWDPFSTHSWIRENFGMWQSILWCVSHVDRCKEKTANLTKFWIQYLGLLRRSPSAIRANWIWRVTADVTLMCTKLYLVRCIVLSLSDENRVLTEFSNSTFCNGAI